MADNPSDLWNHASSISGYRPRLENVHQGCNPFLDQINQKDDRCLINELCLLHRLKPEYELIDVQGPEHSKVFTVYLKLGVSEKHHGQGSSIRRAQCDAARKALQKTRLKFPCRFQQSKFSPKPAAKPNPISNAQPTLPTQFNGVNCCPNMVPNYGLAPSYLFPSNSSNPRFVFDPLLHKQYLVYELPPPPPLINFPPRPTFLKDMVQMKSSKIEDRDRSKKLAKKQAAQNMLNENGATIVSDKTAVVGKKNVPIQDRHDSTKDSDSNSNKCVTVLYDLARNMSIPDPVFAYEKITNNHPLLVRYNKALKSESSHIIRVETILFLTNRIDPKRRSEDPSIRAFGFGYNRRMAKQISVSILLLRMGIDTVVRTLDPTNHQPFYDSFRFSMVENSNLFKHEPLHEFQEEQEQHGQDDSGQLIDDPKFSINYQFVLFILKKFYHYTLKDPGKHCKMIVDKFRFLLPNFRQNYPQAEEFEHLDEEAIQRMISSLNLKSYWDHLRLITGLLTLGIQSSNGIQKDHVMAFQERICVDDPQTISFITVRLNQHLNRENFALINKHYVAYGIGTQADAAREAASLKVLTHLALNSMQHFIRNKSDDLVNRGDPRPEPEAALSPSKPSGNQKKSKQCLQYLYKICHELFIQKPTFIYHDDGGPESQHQQQQQNCTCILNFKKESGEMLSAMLRISSTANSKRLCRTILAYMVLSILNIPELSLARLKAVFQIPDFEKYLKYSIEHDPVISEHHYLESIKTCPSLIVEPTDHHKFTEETIEEIQRNMKFLEHLLQEVYQSHLKNQKRSNPSCLLAKLEAELFEYHNHRKQILDQGDSFDRWSDHVREWITGTLSKFDGRKYWDHLRLLSMIGSTLNTDLDQLLDPLVFEFRCKLIQTHFESQTPSADPGTNRGSIAIITLHSWSETFPERFVMLRKEFLSFSLDHDRDEARELASYKALRYLAINLWKSDL